MKGLENPENIDVRTLDESVPDLQITDKLVNVPLDQKADLPQILKFAAQREAATYDFYIQIASKFKGTGWGKMFHNFALEELNHKKLLEEEYDEIMGWYGPQTILSGILICSIQMLNGLSHYPSNGFGGRKLWAG